MLDELATKQAHQLHTFQLHCGQDVCINFWFYYSAADFILYLCTVCSDGCVLPLLCKIYF